MERASVERSIHKRKISLPNWNFVFPESFLKVMEELEYGPVICFSAGNGPGVSVYRYIGRVIL